MSDKGLYQTGLVFAGLTALGWVLFLAGGMGSAQADGGDAVANYLARADSLAIRLYTWGGVLGSLSLVPVLLAFLQGFRRETGSVLTVPVAFALIGVVFLTLGFMVDTGSMIYYFGPMVAAAEGPEAGQFMNGAQLAQDSIEVTWAVGSFLAYGGSVLWIAILLLRSRRVPRWMNWVGILGGLAAFVWLIRFIPVPAPQAAGMILILLNIALTMVWLVGVASVLALSNEEQP